MLRSLHCLTRVVSVTRQFDCRSDWKTFRRSIDSCLQIFNRWHRKRNLSISDGNERKGKSCTETWRNVSRDEWKPMRKKKRQREISPRRSFMGSLVQCFRFESPSCCCTSIWRMEIKFLINGIEFCMAGYRLLSRSFATCLFVALLLSG